MNIENFVESQRMQGKVNAPYMEYFNKHLYGRYQNPALPVVNNVDEEYNNYNPNAQADLGYPKIIDVDSSNKNKQNKGSLSKNNLQSNNKTFETKREAPNKNNYVIHQVKSTDTIEKLCLLYGVNKDIIRMANDFLGEEIYMFKTLKIPYTFGPIYEIQPVPEESEEAKKFETIKVLSNLLKDNYRCQKNFDKEAKYYLESNGYNIDKAISEFEVDLEFEKRVVKENNAYKKKKIRNHRNSRRGMQTAGCGCFSVF